jgi:hypothetical protein
MSKNGKDDKDEKGDTEEEDASPDPYEDKN